MDCRALGAEQTVAALQQDLASWQGRYKKRDCELASQTSKVHTDCLTCLCSTIATFRIPKRLLYSFQTGAVQLPSGPHREPT